MADTSIAGAAAETLQLSIVVPTFNEKQNISVLAHRLNETLGRINWELIVVDDASPDGTGDVVRALARRDRRVRLISRHNRRGLSSAVVEGALAAAAEVIVVMDGDLQHDETVVLRLYETVASGEAELACASRFLAEPEPGGLSSESRLRISKWGVRMANRFLGLDLTDPLTGFFAIRRDVFVSVVPSLTEIGFKILLDIVVSSNRPLRVKEVPFRFRARASGRSKLDQAVLFEFFMFFLSKTIGRVLPVPTRFYSFAFVGGLGVFVHLLVLTLLMSVLNAGFAIGQTIATLSAMVFNFSLNNAITYFDRQLRSWAFLKGLIVFSLLCSVGVVGNVSVATTLYSRFQETVFVLPALAGIAISVVWNYVATSLFVWNR